MTGSDAPRSPERKDSPTISKGQETDKTSQQKLDAVRAKNTIPFGGQVDSNKSSTKIPSKTNPAYWTQYAEAIASDQRAGNEWKPPGGDHIYTTKAAYVNALWSDRQEQEQYVKGAIEDVKYFQKYFRRNEITFRMRSDAPPAIVNKRNEYSDRCEEIQQAIDLRIEQEGDTWKPENNPDPRVWKPEGDHIYPTGVDYVKVLVRGQDEQEQYLGRAAKDIERLSKYLRINKAAGNEVASDTKNRRDEYMRRYEDILEDFGLKVYGWDEPVNDPCWEPYYRRNPENKAAWMPYASQVLEGHSYTTGADYVRALVSDLQEKKEQYVKKALEDVDQMNEYIEKTKYRKGYIDERNRQDIIEGRDEYVRRTKEIREDINLSTSSWKSRIVSQILWFARFLYGNQESSVNWPNVQEGSLPSGVKPEARPTSSGQMLSDTVAPQPDNPNDSTAHSEETQRVIRNLHLLGQGGLANQLERDAGPLLELSQPKPKEGDHTYTTKVDYDEALRGNRWEKERYLKRLLKDIKLSKKDFRKNTYVFRKSEEATAIENRLNQYYVRCKDIQQAIDALIKQQEGDTWMPENDCNGDAWKPSKEDGHTYTTGVDYVNALVGDRREKEQYVEKLDKDIKRIQEYFDRNAFRIRRDKEVPYIRHRHEQYCERLKDIQEDINLSNSSWK